MRHLALVLCLVSACTCENERSRKGARATGSGAARVEAAQRGALTGRIVDGKRVPLPGVRVAAGTIMTGGIRDDHMGMTGNDGRFAIDNVPAGNVLVTAYGDAHLPLGAELRTVGPQRGDVGDITVMSARPSAADFETPFLVSELTGDDVAAWRVRIEKVLPPGAAAGLRDGDVILAIDGTDVTGVRAVMGLSLVYASASGAPELQLERGETVKLTLARKPGR
jgi:hypothetical protein